MPVKNGFTQTKIANLTLIANVATREELIETTERLTEDNQRRIAGDLGSVVPFERYVDGTLNKPLEQAQQFTLTQFQFLDPIVDEALRMLMEASPTGPEEGGHYRDDHWLYINNVRINNDNRADDGVAHIGSDDVVVLLNARPYARKIEGGFNRGQRHSWTKRRPGLSVQAPNGVYEITAMELRRRFGGVASIVFVYRTAPEGSGIDKWGLGNGYPALEITGI